MRIPLKDDWQNYRFNIKVYPASDRDKECINAYHDDLHRQGKMDWATSWTLLGVSVFVTWTIVHDLQGNTTQTGRLVLDMRETNDWIVKDSYPLTDQNGILTKMAGARFYTVVDGLAYFY
jgi:hypothetical protein